VSHFIARPPARGAADASPVGAASALATGDAATIPASESARALRVVRAETVLRMILPVLLVIRTHDRGGSGP
jgi:hypothetical protein